MVSRYTGPNNTGRTIQTDTQNEGIQELGQYYVTGISLPVTWLMAVIFSPVSPSTPLSVPPVASPLVFGLSRASHRKATRG